MRVLLVAPEAYPLIKVGGLADVVGALPKALRALGVEATVLLPWLPGLEARRAGEVTFVFQGQRERAPLGEREREGVRFLLLGLPDFQRGKVYGEEDDTRRYIRFSLAAAQVQGYDLLHAHDWTTALLALLSPLPVVYTIHNLAHQGLVDPEPFFAWTGLPPHLFHPEALEFYGKVNLMKGGIAFARQVTTVSPSYAEEIQTPEYGAGLDGVIRHHAHKLAGILNGLDTEVYDPSKDPHLPAPYTREDPRGKALARRALRVRLGLRGRAPILGYVGRLDEQKGVDLILKALPVLLGLGYHLALLGVGDPALEKTLEEEAQAQKGRMAYVRAYDEGLARLIYAGAQALLMPSSFEPCGLAQMIAQRYGTPVVGRAVGGLRDTVEDGRTGVLFRSLHEEGLLYGVLRLFRLDPKTLGLNGMAKDFSWEKSARAYLEVYRKALHA